MKKEKGFSPVIGIVLLVLLVACAGGLIYAVGVVGDCQPLGVDLAVQHWFFALREAAGWLSPVIILITHLSDPVVIVVFCALLCLLPKPGRREYGLPISLGALAGLLLYKPLKHVFLRARPDAIFHLVQQGGYSFPSGHAVTSVIVFGLLFYLIRRYGTNEKLCRWLAGLSLFLAITIGITRIYVGVHWPTDVACGWCIGGIVLIAEIFILEKREDRQDRKGR